MTIQEWVKYQEALKAAGFVETPVNKETRPVNVDRYLNRGNRMTAAQYKKEAYARAERTIFMSLDEAARLPGMLAPIVRGQLALYGYCPRLMDGKRTLIIRTDAD